MAKIVSFFNNKGGVGKTTLMYHIAHRLADLKRSVLMVDCDSQCNLTAYALADSAIEKAWAANGNSIYRAIEPVARGIGDIRDRAATRLSDYLHLIPGDLLLSDFEDILGDTWNSAKGGSEPALRAQSAIFRAIRAVASKTKAEIVLVDLGPNLGALNRATLGGSDLVVVPVAPDLFSIRGTENLGSKLKKWRQEWDQCNSAWTGDGLELPRGRAKFLGYVIQSHNLRNNNQTGMTQGWQIFGNRVEDAIQKNIIDQLSSLGQVHEPGRSTFNLGKIPNLNSLIPYSLEARKPIYKCTASDGLRGAHIESARLSGQLFEPIAELLSGLM